MAHLARVVIFATQLIDVALHELFSEELDAVSGGDKSNGGDKVAGRQKAEENKGQATALRQFRQLLEMF